MAYINPGRFIESYLKPYGQQTIKYAEKARTHGLAKERLGAQKSVWAEQIAESQQRQGIAREAQGRLNALSGISPEKIQDFIGIGKDPDTFIKLMQAGQAKLSPLGPDKALTPVWKKRVVKNPVTGKLEEEYFNANDPKAQLKTEIPTKKVKVGGKWHDVGIEAANYIEAQNRQRLQADQKRTADIQEKQKKAEIKYLQDEIPMAIKRGDQQWLTHLEERMAAIVGVSTEGKERDPQIDEARSVLMEARDVLNKYEKISQDPEDIGAQLAPTPMPQIPERQFPLPPKKEDTPKPITPSELRQRDKFAANAESAILNVDKNGNPNRENPASRPLADMFNQYSKKSYVYIWEEEHEKKTPRMPFKLPIVGTFGKSTEVVPGKLVKVEFPVIDGKKVTKAEIWETMEKENMTLDEVLELIGVIK